MGYVEFDGIGMLDVERKIVLLSPEESERNKTLPTRRVSIQIKSRCVCVCWVLNCSSCKSFLIQRQLEENSAAQQEINLGSRRQRQAEVCVCTMQLSIHCLHYTVAQMIST